jgi:hypothetical protein
MKKFTVIFYILLYGQSLFGVDLSPWLVIDNKTKLDMQINIASKFYLKDNQDNLMHFNLDDKDFENLDIYYSFHEDNNEKIYLNLECIVYCKAESQTILTSMLFCDEVLCNPVIESVTCTNLCLQLQTCCDRLKYSDSYITVQYDAKSGINLYAQPIPIYSKYLQKFKKIVQSLLVAALQATNSLPY